MDNQTYDLEAEKYYEFFKNENLTYDELLKFCCNLLVENGELASIKNELLEELKSMETALKVFSNDKGKNIGRINYLLLERMAKGKNAQAIALLKGIKIQKIDHAKRAANARYKNDPRQIALAEIKQQYQANKTQFKRRGYSAQFIREMHDKYPIIESQKTIENLVSALNKTNEDIPR